MLPYPKGADCAPPATACMAEARDFALGGARIVGTSRVPEPGVSLEAEPALRDTAFVYSPATGALRLSNLDFGLAGTGAYAISSDGRVVAGFGGDDRGQQAVVWVEGTPARVEDVLLQQVATFQKDGSCSRSQPCRPMLAFSSATAGVPRALRKASGSCCRIRFDGCSAGGEHGEKLAALAERELRQPRAAQGRHVDDQLTQARCRVPRPLRPLRSIPSSSGPRAQWVRPFDNGRKVCACR